MGDGIVTAYDLTRLFDLLICQYELQLSTNTVINFIFSFDHYPDAFNHKADVKYGLCKIHVINSYVFPASNVSKFSLNLVQYLIFVWVP